MSNWTSFKSDWKKRRTGEVRVSNTGTLAEGQVLYILTSECKPPPSKGGAIRAFTVSLLGAIVLAAGLVVIRNHKVEEEGKGKPIPPGETVRSEISLDRLREIGL